MFTAALWSPAGKGLTSWLSCMCCFLVFLSLSHVMRNARFGPLTLLMTLRVINVKSDDNFMRLFYVSIHDANIRFMAEAVFYRN